MSIPYRFMPWVRRGLARSHVNADDGQTALAVRPKVNVGLTLKAKQDGNAAADVLGKIDLTLYGPGDILGIDPRLIVRTEPKANITNFEPNYLAAIDFDPPDFPWLLTPAKANGQHQLRPWLVLVVFDRSVVRALPRVKPGQPLPSVALTTAQMATELPDLAESWLWAHAQAISEESDPALLNTKMQNEPARNISRLVCPRRLQPRKDYVACVVPAFEAGRMRGLGLPLPDNMTTLTPAWSQGQATELPIYFHWEFSTGPAGDIETLARRLRTPEQYKDDTTLMAQLRHIGEQRVAVDGDHLLFQGTSPSVTVFEGAMVSLGFEPEPANKQAVSVENLAAMLNSGEQMAAQAAAKAPAVPTLAPPLYGEHAAKRHIAKQQQVNSHWLDQLNLQPRYRLAAGWGAEVVRQHQDEFMQAAWTQVGEVLAAERAFSLSRLSHDVLKRIEIRHLDKLPEHRLLAVLGAARAQIKVGTNLSLYGSIGAATLPDELFDGAMRRLTSNNRATFKLAQFRERALGADRTSPLQQMASLVNTFANATQNVQAIDPNKFVPDGIMGSRAFDAIPLPADPAVMIDLQPYTGLPGTMSAGAIREIVDTNKATLQEAEKTKFSLPKLGDVMRKGLITDTHRQRIQELQRNSGVLLQGDIHQIIQQASRPDAEGVLLTVLENGEVGGQAIKIDARSGNLKLFNTSRTLRAAGAPRVATKNLATLPNETLKLYGTKAVISTLPPNTVGEETVRLKLDQPGRFSSADVVAPARPTITMPPAVKDPVVVRRYVEAFKDYQQLWVAPQADLGITIAPINFALTQAASQVRTRIDPSQSVPARLASMLSLAEHPVTWSAATGLSHDFISTHLSAALNERLRYVIPRLFDRVMAYPHLPFPLSRKLEKLAPEVFLPGVGSLPDDFIMAVETNPRFVEALMLGANYEMGRELLWQGFPTDQRGTPFQNFWQRLEPQVDIEEIHRWHAAPLGKQPGSAPMLVLLIRGQLLQRFPTLSIYAYPKDGNETRPGGSSPPVPAGNQDPKEMNPARVVKPVMKGHLGKDITYIGFNIDPDAMEKFFYILEEHMTEPRFGFDEPDNDGQNSAKWLDVDWSEVDVNGGAYFGSSNLRQAPPAQANAALWQKPHAAQVAEALLQRPFRGYYAGARLKMPKP